MGMIGRKRGKYHAKLGELREKRKEIEKACRF